MHIVQFYDDEGFPDAAVARFLTEGLQSGGSVVLFLTSERTAAIRAQLALDEEALAALERTGRLVLRDARGVLDRVMVGGSPDRARFAEVVGEALVEAAASAPNGRVWAHGDMVELLSAADPAAAVELERCWNEVLAGGSHTLYCTYPLRHFDDQALARAFGRVCDEHDDVVPVLSGLDRPDEHGRCIAILQQQARALRVEVAERRRAEERLAALARMSQVLASSLDYERTLEAVIELCLPVAGDLGFVDAWDPEGRLRHLARAPDDPAAEALLGAERWFSAPALRPFVSGQAALAPDIDDAWMQRSAAGPEELARMRKLGFRSMMAVPLRYGGRLLGGLTLFRRRQEGQHAPADLELGRELANRAATALENARLFRERAEALRLRAEADRRKDDFLAMLGHELRNPLAPITTAVEVMEMRGDPGTRREIAVIRRQAQHLKRLVDDLLDVSRIARGALALRTERVELSTAMARALEVAQPLLERYGHHLSVEVAQADLAVQGDPVRLAQIFENLLANAAKYTPPGGRIGITGRREGGDAVVAVRDTGQGIRPELLPSLFEPFVQGGRGSDRAQGGLGLGLSLVKTLVTLHGGTVTAASEGVGRGSTFTVRLPALPLAVAPERGAPPAPAGGGRGPQVLVVDDNRDAVDLLAEALRESGLTIHVAYDGPEALRDAAESPPDVALVDLGLPVMDGFELAARLREALLGRSLRLIALTGYGQESDRQRTREAGFDVHLTKPADLETIERAIRGS